MKSYQIGMNRQREISAFVSLIIMIILLSVFQSFARQPSKAPDWDAWQFLLGDWIGVGGGSPGQGTGGFSFSLDLDRQILVRKNRSDFPASKNRPASSHVDWMIIYQEPQKPVQAMYFDNEGHVIHYAVKFSSDRDTVTFVSDPKPPAPRFRLVYVKTSDQTLSLKFEIAPPDNPEAFSTYIESTARKK